MKLNDLEALLVHEVRDLLHAEKQLVKALPKMASAATHPELKKAFESHLEETKGQVERLERVCEELGIAARGERCQAMEGLVKEASELLEQEGKADAEVLDAALIGAAQRVEHYEMAGYGCARAFAKQLGHSRVVELLQETLDEEGEADKKLNRIAEKHVSPQAAAAGSGAGAR